jgi:hypothetical protein
MNARQGVRIADEQDPEQIYTVPPLGFISLSQTSALSAAGYTSDICTVERLWRKLVRFIL